MEIEFRSSLNGLNIKSKPYILLSITYIYQYKMYIRDIRKEFKYEFK